MHYK